MFNMLIAVGVFVLAAAVCFVSFYFFFVYFVFAVIVTVFVWLFKGVLKYYLITSNWNVIYHAAQEKAGRYTLALYNDGDCKEL